MRSHLLVFTLSLFVVLVGCREDGGEEVDKKDLKPFGQFVGEPEGRFLPPRPNSQIRQFVLSKDFLYLDPDSVLWTAPAGDTVNGASIPPSLWGVVGPPYNGPYFEASVIHDVGCVQRTRSMEDTHRAFYYGSRLGGVAEYKAKLMYWAVSLFAERWPDPEMPLDTVLTRDMETPFEPSDTTFAIAAKYFEFHNDELSLEYVEQLSIDELERRVLEDIRLERYDFPEKYDRLETEAQMQNQIPGFAPRVGRFNDEDERTNLGSGDILLSPEMTTPRELQERQSNRNQQQLHIQQ